MNPSSKYDHVLALLEDALPLLQIELEKGSEAVDSIKSLAFMKARLEDMAGMIRAKAVQKEERYRGSMGNMVVDTWPRNHSLGSNIAEIEYEFYRLK